MDQLLALDGPYIKDAFVQMTKSPAWVRSSIQAWPRTT
jgi:hypothetical protein